MGEQPPLPPVDGLQLDAEVIQRQLAREAQVVANLWQQVLVVPANAVRLRLRDFERDVTARVAWAVPAGFAVGCLANLLGLSGATTFEPLFGLNRDEWRGMNIAGVVILGLLTAWFAWQAWKTRKRAHVESVMDDLLRQSARPPETAQPQPAQLPVGE